MHQLYFLAILWHTILFASLKEDTLKYHCPSEVHDFHISRCEINYETLSGDLQIAAHIFIDDLQSTLSKIGKGDMKFCTAKESAEADQVIEDYLEHNLIIRAGGKVIKTHMIGKESSTDMIAVWCYLEVTGLKNISEIEVQNKILTELYNDQKNIVDFTVNKKKKHFTIFDQKKSSTVYRF